MKRNTELAAHVQKYKTDFAALKQSTEKGFAKYSNLKGILGLFMKAAKQRMNENNGKFTSLNQTLDCTVATAILTAVPLKMEEREAVANSNAKLKEPPATVARF